MVQQSHSLKHPKVGDKSKIIFYKGTGAVDVVFRDIIPPVKIGDTLQILADESRGQESFLDEDVRVVDQINATDLITTDPYYGPGNTADENLTRPVTLCRQTEDKIIDNIEVGKDRELYEPGIQPGAYLLKSVGIGSTVIYVDNIRPFFNSQVEDATSLTFQNKVTLVSQDTKTGAAATAIVSGLGTISSISISIRWRWIFKCTNSKHRKYRTICWTWNNCCRNRIYHRWGCNFYHTFQRRNWIHQRQTTTSA